MKIAYNPKEAGALVKAPANFKDDIIFDLSGKKIFAKDVEFKGTDTVYSVFKKDTSEGKGGYSGLVPKPNYNSNSVNRYLREDGNWTNLPINSVKIGILEGAYGEPTLLNYTKDINIPIKQLNAEYLTGIITKPIYYAHHPELSTGVIPFLYNDLAFLLKRGGEAKMYRTTDIDYSLITLSLNKNYRVSENIFDASPSYMSYTVDTKSDILILDINTDKTYAFNTVLYIDFGGRAWGAKTIKAYIWNSYNPIKKYSEVLSVNNNEKGSVVKNISYYYKDNSGKLQYGFNRLRIVFTDYHLTVNNSPRIALIGLINYGSIGIRHTYMSRGIDDPIYRSITPAYNNSYNLGSNNNRWQSIYSNSYYSKSASNKYIILGGGGEKLLSELAGSIHTHTSKDITKLIDYSIGSDRTNLTVDDSLNLALGKLEYRANLGLQAYDLVYAANNGETIDNLTEILNVLNGIKDTDNLVNQLLLKFIPLSGTPTTKPITGSLWFKNVDGIKINSFNKDLKIWEVVGNDGSYSSLYGFHEIYKGTGMDINNSLDLYAHNKNDVHLLTRRVYLNGVIDFYKQVNFSVTPKVNNNKVSLEGHTHDYLPTNGKAIDSKLFNGHTLDDFWMISNINYLEALSDLNTILTGTWKNTDTYTISNFINCPKLGEMSLINQVHGGKYSSLIIIGNYGLNPYFYIRARSNTSFSNWKQIAYITDIPTVTDYYWANVKVSDKASENTVPTFNKIFVKESITAKKGIALDWNQVYKDSDNVDRPWYGLSLNGNATTNYNLLHLSSYYGMMLKTYSTHNILFDTNFIGINTTNPSEKLDVNGNIKVNHTIKSNDILVLSSNNEILLVNKNNNKDALVLNSTSFKPFNTANNLLDLGATSAWWKDAYIHTLKTNNITELSIGGGIYWNPYVESSTDYTDAASITVLANTNGGTELRISLQNDPGDHVNIVTASNNGLKVNNHIVWNEANLDPDAFLAKGNYVTLDTELTITATKTLTSYFKIIGTAADRHLITRGIGGCTTDGKNIDDIYINYNTNYGLRFGTSGLGYLNSEGSISAVSMILSKDGNALYTNSIRGRNLGNRKSEFIHMYERVHIGSPNGWGSYDAPLYGLSTFGGAEFNVGKQSNAPFTFNGYNIWHAGNFNPLDTHAIYTSKNAYASTNCTDYCTRTTTVSWADSEIKEPKNPDTWKIGNVITFIIPCTDNTYYISKLKVTSASSLQPLNNYYVTRSYVTTNTELTITAKKVFANGLAITNCPQNNDMPFFLGLDAFSDGGTVKWVSKNSAKVGYATTSSKLTTVSKTAWGLTYWTDEGVPTSINGNMTDVGEINACIKASGAGNARLQIQGISAGVDYVHLYINGGSSNTRPLILQNGYGNVGIGTNNPTQKLTVNGYTQSSGFVKTGSSKEYVLLGDGDHKAISDFSLAHSHPYLPLSGGTMTGTIKFRAVTEILNAEYGGSFHNIIYNHANGNLSILAPGGNLYLAYSNKSTIYCRGYYVNLDSGNSSISGQTITINGNSTTWTDTNTWRPITTEWNGDATTTSVSQSATKALYNSLVNGYANVAGCATSINDLTEATSDSFRPVYFAWVNNNSRPVYNNNFKYNPSTAVLLINGNTVYHTGNLNLNKFITEHLDLSHLMPLHPNNIILTPSSSTYGCKIDFASNDQGYAYIQEDSSDHLIIHGNQGVKLSASSRNNITLNGNPIAVISDIPSIPNSLPANGGNADTVDGYHAAITNTPFGVISPIGTDGVMEIGGYLDFHYDNTSNIDYSTRLYTSGNHSNTVALPASSGTLALTSLIPSIPSIPVVTDYYWANVKVSSSSSTTTSPTFGNVSVTKINSGCGSGNGFGFNGDSENYGLTASSGANSKVYLAGYGGLLFSCGGSSANLTSDGYTVNGNITSINGGIVSAYSVTAQNGYLFNTSNGYTTLIGAQNDWACHFSTTSPRFWMNKSLYIEGDYYGTNGRLAYVNEIPTIPAMPDLSEYAKKSEAWLVTDDVVASSIKDYNNSSNHIQIGYSGASLNSSTATYFAAYDSGGNHIKDLPFSEAADIIRANASGTWNIDVDVPVSYTDLTGSSDYKRIGTLTVGNTETPVYCTDTTLTLYNLDECTTYTSDDGACTPAAVKKGVLQFGVDKTGDTMTGGLTIENGFLSTDYILPANDIERCMAIDAYALDLIVEDQVHIGCAGCPWDVDLIVDGKVTASSFYESSDIRLKSNIENLSNRGRLRPVSYIKNNQKELGFIAQEVQLNYPELIYEDNSPEKYLNINYGELTAVLAVLLYDVEDEVTILKNKVAQLEKLILILSAGEN